MDFNYNFLYSIPIICLAILTSHHLLYTSLTEDLCVRPSSRLLFYVRHYDCFFLMWLKLLIIMFGLTTCTDFVFMCFKVLVFNSCTLSDVLSSLYVFLIFGRNAFFLGLFVWYMLSLLAIPMDWYCLLVWIILFSRFCLGSRPIWISVQDDLLPIVKLLISDFLIVPLDSRFVEAPAPL